MNESETIKAVASRFYDPKEQVDLQADLDLSKATLVVLERRIRKQLPIGSEEVGAIIGVLTLVTGLVENLMKSTLRGEGYPGRSLGPTP